MKHKLRTVVIGGSSGMGLATAQLLYSLGHDIVIASRSKDKLEQAVKTIGKAETYSLDITKEKDLDPFFKSIGPFDHLVVSAAGFTMGSFLTMPLDEAKQFFDSKFWGQYLAATRHLPLHIFDFSCVQKIVSKLMMFVSSRMALNPCESHGLWPVARFF